MTESRPRFSVIIPARNEQERIDSCLTAIIRAATFAATSCEMIVVLNRCTDNTEAIARAAGCIIVRDDSKNLARIRNAGARVAKGEILITIDADSIMSKQMLQRIDSTMRSGRYIGGGVMMFPERYSLGIILTGLFFLPIVLRHQILCGLFFCQLEDFNAIGGFNEKLVSVEDIDFAKRLKKYGKERGRQYANIVRAVIITSCRKFDRFGDWYFLKNPKILFEILKGTNEKVADVVWYDFER